MVRGTNGRMATVDTPLVERARSIFSELGYAVSVEGSGLRAERKWRVVHVTTAETPDVEPDGGELQCVVTRPDAVAEVRRRLGSRDPDCEWALIAVDDDGDYEVVRAPDVPAA